MTPNRFVNKFLEETGITLNIVADDDGNGRVKIVRNIGDWRYVVRYNQEDDTKVLLIIKHRTLTMDHHSRQNTKKSFNMLKKHVLNPSPAFKLLYKEQEATD